ncbi:hypothetical protein LRAMOSA00872 [Lichtheimia ramosa]|uniref:Uncharacterized protein n=1 Tax=Lichtheimia ramosa TaxID=688394 RepID=A0A077W9L4_9FUNG|nr:hypothetical protein LRAMOSA00872 [Lichtheimia ramosa]
MARLDLIFALHAAVHAPLGIALLFAPHIVESVLSLNDNAAAILAVRGYGAAILGPAIASLMCFNLPDMLPCKRATATGLMVYHTIVAYLYFEARKQDTLPYMTATGAMLLHIAFLAVFYIWSKVTENQVKAFSKQQRQQQKGSRSH